MNKLYAFPLAVFLVLVLLLPRNTWAQAFHKGSLLVGVTEGSTFANYATTDNASNTDATNKGFIRGDRDPLMLEYGLTRHWGVGLSIGTDLFVADPSRYYGFTTTSGQVKVLMSEVTMDANYHYFTTKRTDLSVFGSFGRSSVAISGKDADANYKYTAGGGVLRMGAKGRYYFFRRFGVLGMVSVFSNTNSTKDITGNTFGTTYSTSVKGWAWEMGFCYRFLK